MRQLFNDGQYVDRAKRGELNVRRTANNHMEGQRPANCPYCTYTQEYIYVDPASNDEVARVHQYLRPDGTLGASGKQDPHFLVKDGVEYHEPRKGKTPPPPARGKVAAFLNRRWRRARYGFRRIVAWIASWSPDEAERVSGPAAQGPDALDGLIAEAKRRYAGKTFSASPRWATAHDADNLTLLALIVDAVEARRAAPPRDDELLQLAWQAFCNWASKGVDETPDMNALAQAVRDRGFPTDVRRGALGTDPR